MTPESETAPAPDTSVPSARGTGTSRSPVPPWFCEAHRVWTTSDCPACDTELIADLERAYPSCRSCGRSLAEGESAWAHDVKIIEPGAVRVVTRYTCDDCEAAS